MSDPEGLTMVRSASDRKFEKYKGRMAAQGRENLRDVLDQIAATLGKLRGTIHTMPGCPLAAAELECRFILERITGVANVAESYAVADKRARPATEGQSV